VVRGATRCGLDVEVTTDLFCGSLSAGDAINAAAAKQLMQTKRLVFTTYFLLSLSSY
jgi:hypothetical protein